MIKGAYTHLRKKGRSKSNHPDSGYSMLYIQPLDTLCVFRTKSNSSMPVITLLESEMAVPDTKPPSSLAWPDQPTLLEY